MKQTLQFVGLMACGLLVAGVVALVVSTGSVPRGGIAVANVGGRSASGIDYVSFAIGLASGLTLAEIARLSWSDMPRRVIAWLLANTRNIKYLAFGAAALLVLIFV